MLRPCWITLDGEIILCPNPMDHLHEAARRFPGVSNPEEHAEQIGWIKISGYRWPPFVAAYKKPTQSQLNAIFDACPDQYHELVDQVNSWLEDIVN